MSKVRAIAIGGAWGLLVSALGIVLAIAVVAVRNLLGGGPR